MSTGNTAFLESRAPDGVVRRHELHDRVVIGRSSQADLLLDHPSVSRRHAELWPDEQGRWMLRDLNSRNGTTVNGAAVWDRPLQHGDRIAIGEMVLRFELAGPAAPTLVEGEDAPGFTITSLDPAERARVSSQHVAAILSFGRSLADAESAEIRLRRLLELIVSPDIGAWWAYLLQVSDQAGQLRIRDLAPPVSSPAGAAHEPHVSRSVLRAVLEGGEPVVASRLSRLQRFQAELTVSPDSQTFSAVACPLEREGGSAANVLYVILPPEVGGVEWLMLISLAVEQYRNAEGAWAARQAAEVRAAVDREMALARNVQGRTLPRRREAPSLDWAVRFDPCLAVAGDYVDVVTRDDGSVLLLVADAAGKGMQAALITAGLHAIFHTQGRAASTLPEVVAAADQYLKTFLPDGSFVTFAALQLDPRTGEGVCVNCGHPPMIAVDASGALRQIEGGAGNLPLGLCEMPVESAAVRIDPGEWILGYTDGLTEMRNAEGEMLGLERLHEEAARLCGGAGSCVAEMLAQQLGEWLDQYRGVATAGDDRTLLVARRTP
jgi:phosphoserine phosphatase RsbU/P